MVEVHLIVPDKETLQNLVNFISHSSYLAMSFFSIRLIT